MLLSERKYSKTTKFEEFPMQRGKESRTVSLFFYDPDLLSSYMTYLRSSSSSYHFEFKKA